MHCFSVQILEITLVSLSLGSPTPPLCIAHVILNNNFVYDYKIVYVIQRGGGEPGDEAT